ncbi:hypothetical protein [Lactococcus lactis]|uniref:hypothetical protein n=1 Tax=Lactococcus lactis TaxID=1358 RepID=UPI003D0FFE25
MYLKKLKLYETFPRVNIVREIDFNNHVNLIVDESNAENHEKGNGVGKTTALRLIYICLGIGNKTDLYKDSDTKNVNNTLENYIKENKVTADLVIVDDFEKETNTVSLRMELFPLGKQYINDEYFPQAKYKIEMNKILFHNESNSPTYGQLMGMFFRGRNDDGMKFLKFLHTNTTNIQYENIYNFLFELQSQSLSSLIFDLKGQIKDIEDDIENHGKVNNFKSIDVINQRLAILDSSIEKVSKNISLLVDSEEYRKNEQTIQQIRVDYANLLNEIARIQFRIKRIKNIINDTEEERKYKLDIDALKELYSESTGMFGQLNKQFKDLVSFNSSLLDNKIEYFSLQLSRFTKKLRKLQEEKRQMFEEFSSIIMLIDNNKLEEYEDLQKQLENLSYEKGKNLQIIEVYDELLTKYHQFDEELGKVEKELSESDNLEIFNKYFIEYSGKTNNEELLLYRNPNGFPFSISSLKSNFSNGTKKSAIAAFDLAYQSFALDIKKTIPHFFIHDTIENIDNVGMTEIIAISKSINAQYVAAVLKDKVDNISEIKEEDKILKLTETEKLFKK